MADDRLIPTTLGPLAVDTQPALLILAAGFEERARALLTLIPSLKHDILIVRYAPGEIEENDESYARVRATLSSQHPAAILHEVELSIKEVANLPDNVISCLRDWYLEGTGEIWIDTSGLPMFGICSVLWAVRRVHPYRRVRIFYTEAEEYFPTESEFKSFERSNPPGRLEMPEASMTSEMAGNLIPKPFEGALSKGRTCLLLYAGYEKHRSFGVIEQLNPHRLVFIFGKPGRKNLRWRVHMSKRLHETFLTERPTAVEEISTLDVQANLELLREYYEMLFDDHDIAIAPVCSKMQAVAAFLLWEEFRDVQLVFPLPIRFIPGRFTKGIGATYQLLLPNPPGLRPLFARSEAHVQDGND